MDTFTLAHAEYSFHEHPSQLLQDYLAYPDPEAPSIDAGVLKAEASPPNFTSANSKNESSSMKDTLAVLLLCLRC